MSQDNLNGQPQQPGQPSQPQQPGQPSQPQQPSQPSQPQPGSAPQPPVGYGAPAQQSAEQTQQANYAQQPAADQQQQPNYTQQPNYGQPAPAYGAPVPPPPAPPAPARRSRGWIVAIAVVAALLIATLFGMWSCTSAITTAATGTTSSAASTLTGKAVGIIDLDSTIQYNGSVCSPDGLKEQLDEAASNSNIVAVVLRVNSGGGVAAAGEEMTEYLREFMEESGKPVVVSSAASNASAAYMISSQADYIYVNKATAIGSIGTVMQFIDYSGLLELPGIEITDVTSSESKDASSGTRALTDEEIAHYQAQVDAINAVFIENVAEGRDMTTEEVEALATGLSFTGMQAVENGLADEIGTEEDAIAKAAELANCSSYTTVELEQASTSTSLTSPLSLMSTNSNSISAEDLVAALKELESNGSVAE